MRKLYREETDSAFTWDTPGPLAARLEVPVSGAWGRINAGPKRREMLESALSSQAAVSGAAIGISGPALSGKTQAALGLADLRGLKAVYASTQQDQQAYKPQPGMLVMIDPASAYTQQDIETCLEYYASSCPVVVVGRDQERLSEVRGLQSIIRLRLPSASAISAYLDELLSGYPHGLQEEDLLQLGEAMKGLSLPQVNQVAVDAALSRLQYGQPVDRHALDTSLQALSTMQAASERST